MRAAREDRRAGRRKCRFAAGFARHRVDARVLLPGLSRRARGHRGCEGAGRSTSSVIGPPDRRELPGDVPLIVVDRPSLLREGGPTNADDGDDWEDNALRFGVLSKVAAMLGSVESPLEWRPDVVHCNDWPTALAPVLSALRHGPPRRDADHHPQPRFPGHLRVRTQVRRLELRRGLGLCGTRVLRPRLVPEGRLVYADAINTVSPTYAREIQTDELGFGMDGVLRGAQRRLYGVLNGIDTEIWNPQHGPAHRRALRRRRSTRSSRTSAR